MSVSDNPAAPGASDPVTVSVSLVCWLKLVPAVLGAHPSTPNDISWSSDDDVTVVSEPPTLTPDPSSDSFADCVSMWTAVPIAQAVVTGSAGRA